MSKSRKILLAVLSVIMAFSMVFAIACTPKSEPIEIKTIPPIVQHRVGESINLYDYVERQAGVTYTFSMAYEDEEAKVLAANGYYLDRVGEYTLTINGKKGSSTASASLTFSVIEVSPTLWANEVELSSSWLSYTLLYKLLDEVGPFAMPIDGVEMALTHAFIYPAEDDSYGYRVDLTGKDSYIEKFNTATPDELTKIELTEENVDELGFYVKRKKLKNDTSAIKATDGKYYGEKDMQGIFMFLIEGRYEFHYKAFNGGGEEKSRFFVKCTEKLSDLTELEGNLKFDRNTFIATWKPVEGAVKYKVKLLNKNYFIEETSFDCSDLIPNPIMDFTLVVLPIGETQETLDDYVGNYKMTYETPYIGSAGTTLNKDGSITMKGVNPPGELYLNIAGIQNDYYALRGEYGIGSYIDITFKGNNMPSVLLFADEINGSLSYQQGKGIAVVNGLHSSVEGGVKYPGSTNVYGPNRINTHYSYSPVGRLPAAFSQTNAIAREKENPDTVYKYTLGTRLDNQGALVIVSSLTNVDTGKVITTSETRCWYWYDASRNPKALANPRYLDATDVTAGSIVLYAPWKENAADTTFLSVSDPYYVDPNPVLYNDDGSVSLYSQVPAGSLYGSFNGTSNSYVAHEGEYGVGTFVDFEFKGNNMPSVLFFADEVNSIMGFQGGDGIIAVSGILTREYLDNPYHETDNPNGIKPTNNSVKIFGPNRVNMHYTYADLASYGGEFTGASLMNNPDRNYKYTVGTRIDDEGFLRWVAELYDADTGKMLGNADVRLNHKFDMEIPDDKNTPEVEWNIEDRYLTADDVKAGSIVAYAQFKGTTEERTTFKMSEPYTRDTTISKANANENKDGSFTLQGADTTLLWSGPNAATGSVGYVAHNGKYDVGTFVEYTFKGNNMPQVLLFADNMNGNMSGNGGGKGILLLNGIKNSSDSNIVNFQIYGPNRMSGHFPGYSGYRNSTATFALNQNSLITAGDNVEYRYVVGTKVVYEDRNLMAPVGGDWAGQDGYLDAVIYVVAELYNKETNALLGSINTPLRSTYNAFDQSTVNKYLTIDDVEKGHIVAFATLKGLNDDGTVASTTFTCSKKPYTLTDDSTEHKHSFTKMDKNETVHWLVCADETCGAKFNPVAHSGGEATCTVQAVCEVCSASYGELKPHVGGTATCYEAATCEVCGNKYGTYGHDYTMAVEGSIVVEGEYHKYHCGKCDNDTEKELHFGGEATYEELAKCVVCGTGHGDYKAPESNADITFVNVGTTEGHLFDGKRTLTTDSGKVTFTSTAYVENNFQSTGGFSINKEYTDEFIKIGFTALSGDGSSINLYSAMGFHVGFRRTAEYAAVTNPVLSDWVFKPNNDGNYGYFYNKAANAFAYGHGATAIGTPSNLKLVKGNEYFVVLGVTGTAPAAGETDNRTIYVYWLDSNETLIGGMKVTMAKFTSVRPNAVMTDSGRFSINSFVDKVTVSYEVLSSDKALYELNGSKPVEITGVERNKITWKAMENASSYAVKVDDGEWTNVGNVTSYEIPNLVEGTEYTAQVKAVFSDFDSKAGSLTFTYSSHVHVFDDLKTDANYHWYLCECEQSTEKVEHNGGTATTALQAVCKDCGLSYGSTVIPEDIKVLNTETFIAQGGAPTASKGSAKIACAGASIENSTVIGLKKTVSNEFLKVTFNALQDCLDRNSLQKATGLWMGIRRTEDQITTSGHVAGTWGAGPCYNSNDFYAYYGFSAVYFHSSGNSKLMPNWYWSAGNLSKGDQCYWLTGITDAGELKLVLVNETKNKMLFHGTISADNVKAKGALAENGYYSIHSYAGVERTLSWEIMTEWDAGLLINGVDAAVTGLASSTDTVSWTAFMGAETYKVSTDNGTTWTDIGKVTSYKVPNLNLGDKCTIQVKAVFGTKESKVGTLEFVNLPADIELINVASVSGSLSTASGSVTVTSSKVNAFGSENAVIGLKKQYDDEFIRVKFKALSGDGASNETDAAMGFSVGFRRDAVNVTPHNSGWVVAGAPSGGMILRTYYKGSVIHVGHSWEGKAYYSTSNPKLVKDTEYYFTVGVTGTVEGDTDNRVIHAFWSKLDGTKIAGYKLPVAAFVAKYSTATMADSGYFTIHPHVETISLSYEILDSATALA